MENCPSCGENLKGRLEERFAFFVVNHFTRDDPNSDRTFMSCPKCDTPLRVTVRAEPVYLIEAVK